MTYCLQPDTAILASHFPSPIPQQWIPKAQHKTPTENVSAPKSATSISTPPTNMSVPAAMVARFCDRESGTVTSF
jgi:hypothetical protein